MIGALMLFALAALLSAGVVRGRLAFAAHGLDLPGERSLHSRPTPHGGGLGIVVALLCGGFVLGVAPVWLLAVLVLAGISFYDDWRPLPAALRLPCHLLVAALVLAAHGVVWWWLLPLALWLAWCMNAFNFMDGADGLAGAMAMVGFAAYGVAFWQAGWIGQALFCGLIVAATAGFLVFNWPPARIFMGDVGSIPLGFLAGGLGWLGVFVDAWPAWFPCLVFAPFLLDATVTLLRRLLRGERIWQAHRQHYFQRMVGLGLSHAQLCARWLPLMVAGAVLALALLHGPSWLAAAGVLLWLGVLAWLARGVDRRAAPFSDKS